VRFYDVISYKKTLKFLKIRFLDGTEENIPLIIISRVVCDGKKI